MQASKQADNKQNFNILVVENSKTTRLILQQMLKNNGYNSHAVVNGSDAITEVQARNYSLVLMDLYMPNLNGYEAAKKIRELDKDCCNIPIIALTASTDAGDVNVCRNAGMNEFFLKSMGELELINTIEKYRALAT